MAGKGGGEGRDRADAAAQPPAYGHLDATEQRGRSVRGAEAGGAFGRPADHADLRACAGGGAQAGGGGAGSDRFGWEGGKGGRPIAPRGHLRGIF